MRFAASGRTTRSCASEQATPARVRSSTGFSPDIRAGISLSRRRHRTSDIDTRSLAALRKPVLVVNGEFDTESRKQAGELLVRILPAAEHALVPQAGHLANLDNTPAYNEIVRGFLQRQARVAA